MSSARRAQEYRRQSWKGGGAADVDPRAARRVRRIVGTLLAACLLGCFAWVLYRMSLPDATTYALCVAIDDYDVVQAPPLAFATETLAEFEPLADRRGVKLLHESDVKTAEALGRLFQQGLPHAALPDKDVVIVYLAAHGVSQSDAQGGAEAWLLGSDYGSFRDGGKLAIDEVLKALVACRAQTRLLVLDAGSIESDPGLSMVVNEFPALVREKVSQLADENVWVLLSHDLYEKSHAAFADRRSAFGYYVARGLAGDADDDGDGVDLGELYDYVRGHVARYVWQATEQQETQTPALAVGGGDQARLLARAGDVRLAPPRPVKEAEGAEGEQPSGRDQASGHPEGTRRQEERDRASGHPKGTRHQAGANLQFPGFRTVSAAGLSGLALAAAPEATAPKSDKGAQADSPATTKAEAAKPEAATPADSEKTKESKPVATDQTPPAESPTAKSPAVASDKKQAAGKAKKADALAEALRKQWLKCDRLSDRTQTPWTPIDYEPRRWLRHVELLKGYESQWLLGASSLLAGQRVAKVGDDIDWEAARQEFERSAARSSLEQHTALSSAVKLRDELLLMLRYYAAWAAGDDAASGELVDLLGPLAELLRTLDEPPARQDAKGQAPGAGEWLAGLDVLRDDLARRKERLDGAWQAAVRASLTSQGLRNAAAIERLLAFPSISANDRLQLLDRLKNSPKLADADEREPPESRRQIELRARQRASQFASLQWRLLHLTRTPEKKRDESFQQQCRQLAQTSSPEPDVARKVGAALAEAYRELGHAAGMVEDRVRLADVRSEIDAAGETLITDHPFPDLGLAWKLGLVAMDGQPAKGNTPLRTDADTEISWRIDAAPPAPIEAKWSLDYDASLLTVAGATRGVVALKPNGAAPKLSFAVRARSEHGGKATLALRVEAPTASARGELPLLLPQWQPIELVVDEPDGLARATVTTDSRGLNKIVLEPLPSGKSVFHVALYNPSARERKIKYQLFTLSRSGLSARALRNWPLKPNGEWLPTVRPLSPAAVTVTLAAQDKKLLSFPPFPKPAPPEGAPAAPPKTDAVAASKEKPLDVGDGLVCEVTDLTADPAVATRRFWIELAALHPRRYVVPAVRYNWQKQRIEVDVKPREAGVLAAEGSTIVWRTEGLAGEELSPIIGKLTADQAELSLSSKIEAAKVSKDRPLDVLLDVDGYPRAFRYDVWCDRPRGESPRKESPELRFLSPPSGTTTWLKNGTPFTATMRVDAPPDWFDESDHVVEVGTRSEPRQTSVFGRDRRFEAFLLPAENEGDMLVEGRVGDLQVEFGTEAYPDQDIDVAALLIGTDRQAQCTVGLDGKAPYFEFNRSLPKATEGKNLSLSMHVLDDHSGVEKVEVAVDADDTGEMKQPLKARPNATSGDVYEVSLPTKALTPGRYTALVRATDKAGNVSDIQPLKFEVLAEAAGPTKSGDAKQTTRLVATVKFAGVAAADFKVTVTGPKNASATTDRNGQFTLKDLPPGSYKLHFEGYARSTYVKTDQELTVEPQEGKPQQATFNLR